jgi:hypothetical protein
MRTGEVARGRFVFAVTRWALGTALVSLAAAAPLAAATITVTVSGKLTAVGDAGAVTDGSLAIDAPYTLVMSFDPATAVDREPNTHYGDYAIAAVDSSYVVTVGNYSFSSNGFLVLGVIDGFFAPSEDTLQWFTDGIVSSGPLLAGIGWGSDAWSDTTLTDLTGTSLSSDSLVSVNWNRAAYGPSDQAFYVFAEVLDPRTPGRDFIDLHGTIGSMVVSAPEPSALASLAALALAAAVVRRRPR